MGADRWLLFQLADGSFPSGGFAHSAGLEAFAHLGPHGDVARFLDEALVQAARSAAPFVRHACEAPASLPALDRAYDANLLLRLPNDASRAQGRALASAAGRIFDRARIGDVVAAAKAGPSHHPPVFGALFGALGLGPEEASGAYLHGFARGILSAAVRLGLVGPLEAQTLHAAAAPRLDALDREAASLSPGDTAQTAPLIELYAALHDSLDGRLFQS